MVSGNLHQCPRGVWRTCFLSEYKVLNFFAQDGQSVVKLVILNQLRERNEARRLLYVEVMSFLNYLHCVRHPLRVFVSIVIELLWKENFNLI